MSKKGNKKAVIKKVSSILRQVVKDTSKGLSIRIEQDEDDDTAALPDSKDAALILELAEKLAKTYGKAAGYNQTSDHAKIANAAFDKAIKKASLFPS